MKSTRHDTDLFKIRNDDRAKKYYVCMTSVNFNEEGKKPWKNTKIVWEHNQRQKLFLWFDSVHFLIKSSTNTWLREHVLEFRAKQTEVSVTNRIFRFFFLREKKKSSEMTFETVERDR